MSHHAVPVNDALNRSKLKAGLPWQLWLVCIVVAAGVMALLSIPFGLVLLAGLPASLVLFFRKDERIFELSCCAIAQKSYYDPGKAHQNEHF